MATAPTNAHLSVRTLKSRWKAAPSDMGPGFKSVSASPTVARCSNWPRGGSVRNKMAAPMISVGKDAAIKPQRQASSPPISETNPPMAKGAMKAPVLPATSLAAYTRARASTG